jgi:hypothetical protein
MSKMPKKRGSKQDPIVDLAYLMTLLGFIFMIAFANPFNPLPFMVSILGFVAGLYIVALIKYPKEAKYWRKFLLDKLDFLFNWSKQAIKKAREKRKRKEMREHETEG